MNERKKLLILHGWGSNSQRWQKVKEILEKSGIEVLVLDLPGFGVTPPPAKAWKRDDYINWILQRIKKKEWKNFNLLGHSFGGGLAVKMSADPILSKKRIIKKLILCAPAVIKRKSIKTFLFYWTAFIGKKILSLPILKMFYPFAQRLIYKLAGTRDYYIAKGVMKETMKKLSEENLEELLEKIKTPTLIIWGRKDNVLPIKDAFRIKEKIKNSELKIIKEARHSPHRETPEKLSKIIIKFLCD